MKKRYFAGLLALVLVLTLLPVNVWAAQPRTLDEVETVSHAAGATSTLTGEAFLDNDEMFAGYVDEVFNNYDSTRNDPLYGSLNNYGQSRLSGANLIFYNLLKPQLYAIASGQSNSSVIELDLTGMGVYRTDAGVIGYDINLLFDAMLTDFPFELYWYDKTKGGSSSYSYLPSTGLVSSFTFKFSVCQEYAVHTDHGTYYVYQPDPAKTGAATAAAANAWSVVNLYSGLDDYSKLLAYKDWICSQVDYNYDAVNYDYPYGNPWQLIWAFDFDPSTNIVCEGYSKAFKFLCDNSTFGNDINCYLVTGDMDGGAHMWNLVRVNGVSFMTDVTNSEPDEAGVNNTLFMAGTPYTSSTGFTMHIPRRDIGNGWYYKEHDISYVYWDDTTNLFDPSVLVLANYSLTPGSLPNPTTPPNPVTPPTQPFTDVPSWFAAAVDWAVAEGITNGYGNGKFGSSDPCTNAQILTFLWRAAGRPASSATYPGIVESYYQDGVNWAYEKGLVGAGFLPGASCTRASALVYMWLAFGAPSAAPSYFIDVPADAYYAAAVNWAVENGLTNGYGNNDFRPHNVCSRGEIVTFLHRAYVPSVRL